MTPIVSFSFVKNQNPKNDNSRVFFFFLRVINLCRKQIYAELLIKHHLEAVTKQAKL